jgi:hypothetical protein
MSAEHRPDIHPCLNCTRVNCPRDRIERNAGFVMGIIYEIAPGFENAVVEGACPNANKCETAKASRRPGFSYHTLLGPRKKDN